MAFSDYDSDSVRFDCTILRDEVIKCVTACKSMSEFPKRTEWSDMVGCGCGGAMIVTAK